MSKKNDLLTMFMSITGKTEMKNVGVDDNVSQASLHKKYGYQTANLKEYFR
jgi:hypothetical protein